MFGGGGIFDRRNGEFSTGIDKGGGARYVDDRILNLDIYVPEWLVNPNIRFICVLIALVIVVEISRNALLRN